MCLLGLALAALVVDQVFLGPGDTGPEAAAAAAGRPRSPSPAAPTASGRREQEDPTDRDDESLARRLGALSRADGDGDGSKARGAFTMPQGWLAEMQPPPPPQVEETTPKRGYRLMAVMVTLDGGHAIIDGRCLLVGQELDGLKLVSVARDSAVLAADGVRIELQLQEEPQAEQ